MTSTGARKTVSQNDPKQPRPGGRVPACPVSPACQLPRPDRKAFSAGRELSCPVLGLRLSVQLLSQQVRRPVAWTTDAARPPLPWDGGCWPAPSSLRVPRAQPCVFSTARRCPDTPSFSAGRAPPCDLKPQCQVQRDVGVTGGVRPRAVLTERGLRSAAAAASCPEPGTWTRAGLGLISKLWELWASHLTSPSLSYTRVTLQCTILSYCPCHDQHVLW